MQKWVWEARQGFFFKFMSILLNIWPRCSGYSSATYARLLSWIDPENKTFEVGGAPVSLDCAKFLGCHFRLDFQFFLLCLDRFTILGRYFSEYVSFATCFYHFFHSLKISTASSGHLLRLARGLCLGCERRKTFD